MSDKVVFCNDVKFHTSNWSLAHMKNVQILTDFEMWGTPHMTAKNRLNWFVLTIADVQQLGKHSTLYTDSHSQLESPLSKLHIWSVTLE